MSSIVPGVGSLIVNDLLTDVSYALFEGVVNTTITAFTVPAGYGDGGMVITRSEEIAGRMLGVLQTTWSGAGAFIRAYFGEGSSNTRTQEAVMCFRELFREVRASSIGPQYDQSK